MWHFTSEERRGLIIWVFCIISIGLTPYITPKKENHEIISSILKSHAQELEGNDLTFESKDSLTAEYNPNTVTAAELKKRGLPKFVAERWVKFRTVKDGFFNKKDILSIYGIDTSWVNQQEGKWLWESNAELKETETAPKKAMAKASESKPSKGDSKTHLQKVNAVNINRATAETLEKLGLSKSVAHRLVAYRKKAGPFFQHEDLYKIYDIDTNLVQSLIPILWIDTARLPYLDINRAKKEEWENLPGIGPVYAERIVKFRDALGGFVEENQLKEVYGLPESTWLRISPRIELKKKEPEKIKVNHATVRDFARHPYIDWNLAKRLYRYKEQHFPLIDLSGIHGLSGLKIQKLRPYLDFSFEDNEQNEFVEVSPNDSK